ncbi:hypothetical protein DL240_08195 [Lujinxingia litoralis]|uniref:Ig-like domain-containing protein n=1 Tax=Lujinxingia litoralis TaxID=2211119 RepID=A0A328CAN2_9DELT|nr:hypothetical protein [Lujinxingia litoralis]RAL22863.1 hypothetical protein DL240_08195 [Lujinxingia litoralis]
MKGTIRLTLALLGAGLLASCGMETLDPEAPDPSQETGETGLALTIDLSEVETVAGVRFLVETCDGEEVIVDERDLSELDFPDDDAFEELGVAGQEGVIFADYFVVLDAGCYDVELVPIDESGAEVEQCEPSIATDVEVRPGLTTEIAMVSQCGGDNTGAMDVLGVLNFSPALTQLSFDPSKMVACEELTICATGVDSDADDLEFEWEQLAGPTPSEALRVVSTTEPDDEGRVTECVSLTPGNTGAYAYEVRAYDVLVDTDGERVRVEDLLRQAGDDETRSHARLSFPVYATCDGAEEGVLGEVEDERPREKEHRDEEPEGVLGEVEEDRPREKEHRDEVPEEVLGEVEEPEEEHKKKGHRDEEPEEVLGEVEEDRPREKEHRDEEPEEVLGEVEEPEEEHKKKTHRDEEPEEVLGEVEEDRPREKEHRDEEPEEVLGEVEEPEEEHKKKTHRDEEPEEVLGEVEEDRPREKEHRDEEPEEVLGEVEEPEEEHKKKTHRDEEPEEVLGEVEEPEEEHKKKTHRDEVEEEPEDVLGEVEEPEEEHKKKTHRDEVEEEPEDVLGEVEEPEEEHKKKTHRDEVEEEPEDVLGEVEEELPREKEHRDEESEDVLGEVEDVDDSAGEEVASDDGADEEEGLEAGHRKKAHRNDEE